MGWNLLLDSVYNFILENMVINNSKGIGIAGSCENLVSRNIGDDVHETL